MTSASRSNKFDVLNVTERGLKLEDVNAVGVVKEIVEITVDSGDAKSVWPIRKEGVARTNGTKTVRLAVASGCLMHGRRHEFGIRTGRFEVQHEVLGR